MSVQDYMSALKLGKKEYHACVNKGKYPYLPVMENMMEEYMNKFYVLEGNKRVSVLKYFKAVTVNAQVIRKIPKKSDDPDVKIYYEFMDFYKATKLNDIYFSKEGSFTTLMDLVGIEPGKVMDEDAKKDLVSSYLNFRTAYESRGGDRFDFPVGDAYLRFIHIHGYDNVKHMTSDEMDKNVAKTWEEFELISDNSGVELKMDPAKIEPAKKNILSYLLPISGGDSNKKLKVGFIYEKTPQTSEWCYAHELGRQYIDETFGKQIETVSITNVRPKIDDYDAIQKLIDENTDLIFVTSSAMMYASLKQAIAHPKAKILNCSLNISHKYIRTYYTRIHEAKYLTGLIAGVMSKSDRIGYVAGCPLYGVMANVNAFAMGVKAVNPDAKVYVEWNGIKDNDVEARFKELGINCISDQDMITPKKSSRKFGLYINDDGNIRHLAMPVWHWGVFYEKLIQSILSGSWKKEEEGDKVSALNYWWGMSSGAVDIIYGGGLNNETKKIVDLIRESIIKGEFHPFSGELRYQEGNIMNKAGETLDPDEIIEMDWLMDNIVGKIPEYDELSEEYKLLVINQGIIDVNE